MPSRQCSQQPLKDLVVSFGQWRARKESSCNAVHAATHKHLRMHIDDALIWHWIITEVDLPDLFRPIKPFICMLTTEAFPGRPPALLRYLPLRCDRGTMGRAPPEYQSPSCSSLLFVQEDGVQRSLSRQEVKPSIRLIQTHTAVTCTRLKGKKTTGDNERLTRAVFVLSAHLVRAESWRA